MDSQEVGLLKQFRHGSDHLDVRSSSQGRVCIRIVGHEIHAESAGCASNCKTDLSQTNDGEGFALDFYSDQFAALPFRRLEGCAGVADISRDGHEKSNGML